MLSVYCVDLLMWSPTKLDFLFYDLKWFLKDPAEINKKEKHKITQP